MTNDEIIKQTMEAPGSNVKVRLNNGKTLVGRVFYDSSHNDFFASTIITIDEKFKAEDVSSIDKFNKEELINKIQEL